MLGAGIMYGLGAVVLVVFVPLVALLSRAEPGKDRFSPETRRRFLMLYLGVLAMIGLLGLLVKLVMID